MSTETRGRRREYDERERMVYYVRPDQKLSIEHRASVDGWPSVNALVVAVLVGAGVCEP